MLYASGATTISKLALGTTNYVLTAGASGPQYVAQSTLAAGSANNLAGGSAGATPYQTGSGATSFLSLGASGYVLSAGASAPQYVAQSTLSVGTATNLAGGAANRIAYQTGAGATSFTPAPTTSNYVLTWNGTTIDWASVPTVTSAGNLVGGAAGDVVYQSATNVSAFLPDIAVGNALISGGVGVAPSYGKIGLTTHVSGTLPIASGGTNSTATATAGGVGYGTGTAYAFTTAGTTGQALISAGASAPAFGTLGVAGGGTSLTTLTANNVILGNGTSAPLFVAPSTSGNALISNGTTWASQTIPVPSGSQIYTALNFGGF